MSRFDAAQEAFTEGANKHKKSKKKLKSAKAKIKSLKQKVASLEQELKLAKKSSKSSKAPAGPTDSTATTADKLKRGTKSTGARRGRPKKDVSLPSGGASSDNGSDSQDYNRNVSADELAEAVADAPDTVSEAAAEKTSGSKPGPKPRRGRPRKTEGAAKAARKSSTPKKAGTGRRGRPSTKPPASPLTKINGVGVTMATRFEESGVTTVEQFSQLSDEDMKEVLQKCGPRYRSADSARMEGYREAAREAMEA